MTLQLVPIAFAIALGLSSLLSYPTLAQIQISTLLSQKNPPLPPRVRSKPVGGDGGDRGENSSSPSSSSGAKQRPTAYDRTPPPPPHTPQNDSTRPAGGQGL